MPTVHIIQLILVNCYHFLLLFSVFWTEYDFSSCYAGLYFLSRCTPESRMEKIIPPPLSILSRIILKIVINSD